MRGLFRGGEWGGGRRGLQENQMGGQEGPGGQWVGDAAAGGTGWSAPASPWGRAGAMAGGTGRGRMAGSGTSLPLAPGRAAAPSLPPCPKEPFPARVARGGSDATPSPGPTSGFPSRLPLTWPFPGAASPHRADALVLFDNPKLLFASPAQRRVGFCSSKKAGGRGVINAGAFARRLRAAKDDLSSQASGGESPPAPQGTPSSPSRAGWQLPAQGRWAPRRGDLSPTVPLCGHSARLEGARTQPQWRWAGRTSATPCASPPAATKGDWKEGVGRK